MSRRIRRCLAVLTIILTGVLATYRGGAASYLLFECSLMVPCLSLAYLFYVYSRFRVYQYLEAKTVVKGQKVPYSFVLSNEDKITYCNIRITFEKNRSHIESISPDDTYCLLPETQINKRTYLTCKYRGVHRVGIDKIIVTDYLGLFSFSYRCPATVSATVLPRVVHLEKLAFAPQHEEERERRLSWREEIPNMQIRQYVQGDSLKRIHWKASARNQELMTRQYTEESRRKNLLILDLSQQKEYQNEEQRLAYEDKILETGLAIADYFISIRTPLEVVSEENGFLSFPITTAEGFQDFYSFCSKTAFSSLVSASDLIQYVQSTAQNPCCIMVLTGQVKETLLSACLSLGQSEHKTTIYYVGDTPMQLEVMGMGGHLNCCQIFLEQETKEALEA